LLEKKQAFVSSNETKKASPKVKMMSQAETFRFYIAGGSQRYIEQIPFTP
jgi:hypothetical protein